MLLGSGVLMGCASKPQRPSVAKAAAFEKAIDDSRPRESLLSRLGRPKVDAVDVPTWEDTPVKDPVALKLAYAKWMASSGNLPEAQECYEAVLEQDPDNAEALLGLAKIEAESGQMAAATKRFERVAEVAPNSIEGLTARGEFALMQGRVDEAADLLAMAVQQRPQDSGLKHRLAIARGRQGRIEEARRLFVATVGPAEAAYNVGLILRESNPQQAAAEFQTALTLKPSLVNARQQLAALQTGRVTMPAIQPASHATANDGYQPIQR